MDEQAARQALLDEALRIEEDADHSCQSQFEATRVWNGWNLTIGIPVATVAAGASASALADCQVVAAFLSMAAAAGAAIATFVKPSDRAAASLRAGNKFLALRNDTRIFRTVDCVAGLQLSNLREQLGALNDRRSQLNSEAPNPMRRAYRQGRRRIEAGEREYAVDRQRATGPDTAR